MAKKKNKRPRTASSGGAAVTEHIPRVPSRIEGKSDDSAPSFDWIAALASKASSRTTAGQQAAVTTKEERIERRLRKKQRRQLEKDEANERNIGKKRADEKHIQLTNRSELPDTDPVLQPTTSSSSTMKASSVSSINRTSLANRERLDRLSSVFHERSLEASESLDHARRKSSRPYDLKSVTLKSSDASSLLLPAPFKKRKWEQAALQPRKRDYGGIGLARPTLYLELDDPSFVPKLEEEFLEHVPGFYGRSVFHNSQKRQSSQKALWRTLSDRAKASKVKVDGKKLSDLPPDERVEAMLRAGLI